MYNLLSDPLLPLETTAGTAPASLPRALAELCDATLTGFGGLAAHQRPAFFLFLVQLAALALERSGEAAAADDDTAWRALADAPRWQARLAALTPGQAETAWSLVVDDLARPAFLQPPIGSGRLDGYTLAGRTPDEIDVLVTAKDHDVKGARAATPAPWHWLFALLTLQTLQGYSGRGNFGIARMNGGFASRPLVMLTPARDLACRFRRGVQAALRARRHALEGMGRLFSPRGLGLLWLEPWDTDEGLPPQRLDPLFLEICRRLRLVRGPDDAITAWKRPSAATRVATPDALKGNLGDAFVPIASNEKTALTVGPGGFDYRLIARLLDETEFDLPEAARLQPGAPSPDDPPAAVWLHAAVLVRGQGKTEGLHERWVRLPGRRRREKLGRLSKAMVGQAGEAKKALSLALLAFVQGGPDKLDFKDRRAEASLAAFEQAVDRVFFEHLFRRATAMDDATADAAEEAWKAALVGLAHRQFAEATRTLSPARSRREKAKALADLTLYRLLRAAQLLPPRPDNKEETNDAAA